MATPDTLLHERMAELEKRVVLLELERAKLVDLAVAEVERRIIQALSKAVP